MVTVAIDVWGRMIVNDDGQRTQYTPNSTRAIISACYKYVQKQNTEGVVISR